MEAGLVRMIDVYVRLSLFRCLPETITALLMAMPQHKIKKVKGKTKQNTCPGPNLLMDILIGPNFKDFLAWTKYLIDVLEKMKCAMRS